MVRKTLTALTILLCGIGVVATAASHNWSAMCWAMVAGLNAIRCLMLERR